MFTVSIKNFVEQRDISAEVQKIYHYAERIRENFAQSITYDFKNLKLKFVMTKKSENQLMQVIENLYTEIYKIEQCHQELMNEC